MSKYVSKLKVMPSTGGSAIDVEIKALALNDDLYAKDITSTDGGVVTGKQVYEAIVAKLVTNIADQTKNGNYADAKAVKDYVASQISGLTKFDVKVVSSIDDVTETGHIYLVPKSPAPTEGNNYYDEYVYDSSTSKAELIGNTQITMEIATETTAGIVKSTVTSGTAGTVNVDQSTGIMKVNGWGNLVVKDGTKQLSDENYTSVEKTKLADIEDAANKTVIDETAKTITVGSNSITVPDGNDSYNKIIIYNTEEAAQVTATAKKDFRTIGFKPLDNTISITAETEKETGNPIISFKATGTNAPNATYNTKGLANLPTYIENDELIDFTKIT